MSVPAEGSAPEGGGNENTDDDAGAQEALAAAAREAADADDGDDDDGEDGYDPKVKAKIERQNREAKNLRERIKQLEPLAKRAQERDNAEKTEAQRLTEQKAALEVELSELRVSNVRREAAEAVNLPAKFAKFINATEPDEALAQAKELAKAVGGGEGGNGNRPTDLRQGARGGGKSTSQQLSADELIRGMAGRR